MKETLCKEEGIEELRDNLKLGEQEVSRWEDVISFSVLFSM